MTVVQDPRAPQHYSDSRRGVLLMLAAVGVFALLDAMIKHLSTRYPVAQVASLRGVASLPFVLGLYLWRGELHKIRMRTPALHFARGLLAIVMLLTFVYAVRHQTLTGVYALYMIAPILIVALAALLLKEPVDSGRWLAVLLGFVGVWIILQPTSTDFARHAALATLLSALCYAVSALTARRLTRTDTSESMIVSFLVMLSVGAGLLALPDWQPVQSQDWLWIAAIGGVGAIAQHCITDAFRYASASTLAPIEYTALLFALALDWLIWSRLPTVTVLTGGALIVLAGLYVMRRASR